MTSKLFSATLCGLLLLILAACGNTTPSADSTSTTANPPAKKLNLNEASDDEFLTVPGVGNRMVREFKEYRPYVSIEQFRREIGKYVDEEQVAAYEQYVFVPIDINNADAATMMQLPGVDATSVADLIAARPYASNSDFLTKLATYISETDLETAERYLLTP